VIAVALVNHGSPPVVAPGHSPTPGATVAPTPTATAVPPTNTVPPTQPGLVGPAVRGFVPADATAISANEWWVLGYNGPTCSSASCTRILHTTDAGQSFSSIPAPPVAGAQGGQQTVRMRFADATDGWVVGATGVVWATHDGGAHWSEDSRAGSVTDLAASGRLVYAITCLAGNCTLETSPASQDSWAILPASSGHGPLSRLNVNGSHIWVILGGEDLTATSLLASTDGGQHFSPHLVCSISVSISSLYAVNSSVLWAVCATGTEARAYRSVDGGQHFAELPGPPMLPNSATVAGVSSTTAVITSPLQRTVDGGQIFVTVEDNQTQWTVVGFTTAVNGFAFDHTQPLGQLELWRTNDAGAHWYMVRFP
jgi:photosystem II stability/assembly factor-like uncharacterized protein